MRQKYLAKFCAVGLFTLAFPISSLAHGCNPPNYPSNSYCNRNNLDIDSIKGIHFDGVGGFNQVLTIQPDDSGAAIFSITCGRPYQRFRLKVSNKNKFMFPYPYPSHPSDKVMLFNYRFGGSVTRDGYGILNRYGSLSDIRLGASVKIKSKNQKNFYATRPEIRVEFL